MKKLTLMSLFLTAFLWNKAIAGNHQNSFTIGVQGGYNMLNSKAHRNSQMLASVGVNQNDSSNIAGHGVLGGLLIEMNHFIQDTFLIGVQFSALFTNAKGTIKTDILPIAQGVKTSLRIKNSYGAAIRFGKTFDRTLPYLKLGIVNSKCASTTDALPSFFIGKRTKNNFGFEGGIGVDFQISDKISIGSEFSHIEYQKFNYIMVSNAGKKRAGISIKPRENRIMLNFKFRLSGY